MSNTAVRAGWVLPHQPRTVDHSDINQRRLIVNEPADLSSHRVRSNRWPNEPLHAPAALIVAVDDIFTDTIEDRD